MEFKTRKNIIYRINNQTACTYEIDDTPPFPLNREALDIAIEIALLLKTNIVGELHITRKQYLDGSIPTGFQRTAIVGIEGVIPISKEKKVRIIQLSIEEESCREVSDVGHWRIYTTDRLGMPLIETVTYPDMLTPDEAAQAGHYLRFLARSTGKVRTGIGAAREDVNVSINGGTRVEIKGVAHIKWIPELTHNEAFRQKALLEIKETLNNRVPDPGKWKISHTELSPSRIPEGMPIDMKVIACIEKPNMVHSEPWNTGENASTDKEINTTGEPDPNRDLNRNTVDFSTVKKILNSGDNDAQLIFWGPGEDIAAALETIEERCQLAFKGVPNETRKALPNGTTIFERVLPGPNRMYPDTDSAPIPIEENHIQAIRKQLPTAVAENIKQMMEWKIPVDTYPYILKRNLFPLIEKIINDFNQPPGFTGTLIGHHLKYIEGQCTPASPFDYNRIYELFDFIIRKKLKRNILEKMLPEVYEHPKMDFDSVLTTIQYRPASEEEILDNIPVLKEKFKEISKSKEQSAEILWIMGRLRPLALGNMDLQELREKVETAVNNGGNHE
jgi:glutamyl-tRNA(Gln) amidotransferase subunit E